ncbi:malto-oligosyltrehalose trehalohydrolase [Actinocrispum sp. NPDC049592]|uniref:malto-oligosyltrehalose trehalohydrolase n=1 Tax=Actinocrispum sp. NPDC049592 TaxID=3154835 RepID=UPI003420069C
MTFSVWAPGHTRVEISVDGVRHPMTSGEGGWWSTDVSGTDYSFFVDDDPTPLPDPRSLRQPTGVFGPSQVYSHSFPWTDSGWTGRALPGSVIYELHIGTFTSSGTFDAAIARLDHLVSLGVDFIEVMPVNSFDGTAGWGYDGVLWGAVHEPYGGPDGFKRFVDAAHARGLGVVLDVVYNHMGPSGAFLDRFGPYFAGQNIWGAALNVYGPGSDEVRRYVIDNALMWFRDFHVDALRLDAIHAIVDHRAKHILEELAEEVEGLSAGLRRPLTLIAESDLNDPRHVTPRAAGGYGLDAQWCDDIHHALHVFLTGESQGYYADFAAPDAVKTTLENAFFHAGTWSSFRDRTHGRPINKAVTPAHRFLAFLQNHDQIGNRATGDRMSATVSPGVLACGAALVLCSPYTAMIFMGEEWGAKTPWQFFASFPNPELADAVRTGRRREFAEHGWGESEVPDPMDPQTVRNSTLDWSELEDAAHKDLFETYRALIGLRREYPELTDPRLEDFVVDQDDRVITLHRGAIKVICNLSSSAIPRPPGKVLLASADAEDIPSESFVVVRAE